MDFIFLRISPYLLHLKTMLLFAKTIQSTISEIACLDSTDFYSLIDIFKIGLKNISSQLITLQNYILSITSVLVLSERNFF